MSAGDVPSELLRLDAASPSLGPPYMLAAYCELHDDSPPTRRHSGPRHCTAQPLAPVLRHHRLSAHSRLLIPQQSPSPSTDSDSTPPPASSTSAEHALVLSCSRTLAAEAQEVDMQDGATHPPSALHRETTIIRFPVFLASPAVQGGLRRGTAPPARSLWPLGETHSIVGGRTHRLPSTPAVAAAGRAKLGAGESSPRMRTRRAEDLPAMARRALAEDVHVGKLEYPVVRDLQSSTSHRSHPVLILAAPASALPWLHTTATTAPSSSTRTRILKLAVPCRCTATSPNDELYGQPDTPFPFALDNLRRALHAMPGLLWPPDKRVVDGYRRKGCGKHIGLGIASWMSVSLDDPIYEGFPLRIFPYAHQYVTIHGTDDADAPLSLRSNALHTSRAQLP
ncbi:hypothetical protein B0H10DRAFT_2234117 [Mycena sp. CBHHK59/15]|nr:hypothetical protein B0H10DRAFT_2234117 [Mycena sp. CBHHK59/15]